MPASLRRKRHLRLPPLRPAYVLPSKTVIRRLITSILAPSRPIVPFGNETSLYYHVLPNGQVDTFGHICGETLLWICLLSSIPRMNHADYQERLDFVRFCLQRRFSLKVVDIEPIEYDAECPFAYNNFIYGVCVEMNGASTQTTQPGASSIPLDVCRLVMRLSNAAAGLHRINRVENEVGIMYLFRQTLDQYDLAYLIPEIYGWGSAEHGQGWILQEFKEGLPLDRVFDTASDEDKSSIFAQMAEIVYAMQSFQPAESIESYGGVSFSREGRIISGPMTTLSEGPFATYTELYQSMFRQQLTASDKSPVLSGWRDDGIRIRLEKFCQEGLPQLTHRLGKPAKAIVHSDFTMNNILIDASNMHITALLDFDWSFIGTHADDFLRSFSDIGGGLTGPNSKGEELIMRRSILHGFDPEHKFKDESLQQLQSWYKALQNHGAVLPSMVSGMKELSLLHWFVNQISPWMLTHEVPLRRRSKEQLDAVRATTKQTLVAVLEKRGY